MTRARIAYCKCGHEVTRHAIVDGKHQGVCLHGCGCTAMHGRRRRGAVLPGPSAAEHSRQPSIDVALAALDRARAAIHEAEKALRAAPGNLHVVRSAARGGRASAEPRSAPSGSVKGERRILIAIAERPQGATKQQLTVLTGYKRSSRDTYLQRLRAADHVRGAGTEFDRIHATALGLHALGKDYVPLPVGPALIEYWRARLPQGELLIFDTLLRARRALDREEIAQATGYKRSSRDTYLQRLRARGIVLVRGEDGAAMLHQEFWGTPEEKETAR